MASYTDTVPGKLICARAKLKFWNRYKGDTYSHISLSRDNLLNNMVSFARKDMKNPFNAGIIKEDIKKGMFALKKDKSKIAVMEVRVSNETYSKIGDAIEAYWSRKDELKFNFLGLATMLFWARGVSLKNHYFCSQWTATILRECGVELFEGKKTRNIRPFDFYCALQDKIVYEGLTIDYPMYSDDEPKVLKKIK